MCSSFLAGYRVDKSINLVTTHAINQRGRSLEIIGRHAETIGYCASITLQRDQLYAMAFEVDSHVMPGTGKAKEEGVFCTYLGQLCKIRLINEQQAHGLVRVILCGIDADRLALYLYRDEIVLEMRE